MNTEPYTNAFDIVLMEFGILHYFLDLGMLTKVVSTF